MPAETAQCPARGCGRQVGVYIPRHGDTTGRVTYWHKTPAGKWCRSEVDVGEVSDAG